jgi:hypothetical protein
MKGSRLFILALLLLIAGLVLYIAPWQGPAKSTNAAPATADKLGLVIPETNVTASTPSAAPAPSVSPTPPNPVTPVAERLASKQLEKWRTIARGTYLPLVDSWSVTLSKGAMALLDLKEAEVALVNLELASLMERLKAAELAKAYTLVERDGSEKIVVAPFDRRPLLDTFRKAVASKLGENVADFCTEEMFFDPTMSVGGREVRIYIEPGDDGNETLVISRGVHHRNTTGDPKWEGDAAPPLVARAGNRKSFDPRFGHLISAATTLPRKTAPPK